ncbi:thiosulfate sulfurtransferase GlpE [Nitrincola tibetensis]|uniref:Thiosulfate sulfurtransferase GlpE n=1 Tax=Nitrincola tibetensis TaxID=2219697 RepID=A0A364NLE1_9GAMM|nr:thiosulfate sulfurtransferase GlpE [Nitrincola tibetensis]RAU17928.1 thiosulfate sulfurtransferase GlpE [Nitrincola tibetensis]
MSSFKHLSPQTAVELLEQGATLVDIRDFQSYSNAHIPASVHLNNDNLPQFLEQANRNQPLIVCCYHGISSQSAADYLVGQGFSDVYSLDGGFEGWKQLFPDACES